VKKGKLAIRLRSAQKVQLRWRLPNHHGAQDSVFRRFVDAPYKAHERQES
jgi:hypothetical protein